MSEEPMTLFRALRILTLTHTRDDPITGFIVAMGASPHHPATWDPVSTDQHEYFRAWSKLREEMNMPFEPGQIPF